MVAAKLFGLATAAFLIAGMAFGADLTGEYVIEGNNPGGSGHYGGRVAVAQTGETYQVAWIVGKARHLGTGIVTDDVLSVVFQESAQSLGVAVYKIGADGTLTGRWTGLGGKQTGSETWRKDKGI